MKRRFAILAFALFVGSWTKGFADFPIRQSANSDGLPSIAYNSVDHEYLVIWVEVVQTGNLFTFSVMGQRVGEDGAMLGNQFVILPLAVNPSVAYNSANNEYLVGGNPGGGYVGQRVSNTGALLGSPTTLMNGVGSSRLLYNSITGQYLFLGAALEETPSGSGYYNIKI